MRICHERTPGLAVKHQLTQQDPVLIARCQQTNVGLLQPLINKLSSLLGREPLSGKPWIRHDPEEGGDRLPRQSNRYSAGENLLNPSTRLNVMLRTGVICVQKDICVEDNHLCVVPSIASIKSSTLS